MQNVPKAIIGQNGEIILPGVSQPDAPKNVEMHADTWYSLEEDSAALHMDEEEDTAYIELEEFEDMQMEEVVRFDAENVRSQVWDTVRTTVQTLSKEVTEETKNQLNVRMQEGRKMQEELRKESSSALHRFLSFLRQPVYVPNRKKEPVERSRGTLFLLDTIRFGGTFAGLFSFLFIALNFESFFAIAQSYVEPLTSITGVASHSEPLDARIAEKLKKIPLLSVAGGDDSILAHLPAVGPPDNRLVIPKLDLNVPIEVPPNEALLREDWSALEEVIQEHLQAGVVHYPGTARPGQAGNFFITGHSSYFPWAPGNFKSVFARLHELSVGDEYWVFYNGDRHRYIVQEKKEVRPSDVSVLNQPPTERVATLMTCTPIGTTLRRLILVAVEVDPITGEELEIGERGTESVIPALNIDTLPI